MVRSDHRKRIILSFLCGICSLISQKYSDCNRCIVRRPESQRKIAGLPCGLCRIDRCNLLFLCKTKILCWNLRPVFVHRFYHGQLFQLLFRKTVAAGFADDMFPLYHLTCVRVFCNRIVLTDQCDRDGYFISLCLRIGQLKLPGFPLCLMFIDLFELFLIHRKIIERNIVAFLIFSFYLAQMLDVFFCKWAAPRFLCKVIGSDLFFYVLFIKSPCILAVIS